MEMEGAAMRCTEMHGDARKCTEMHGAARSAVDGGDARRWRRAGCPHLGQQHERVGLRDGVAKGGAQEARAKRPQRHHARVDAERRATKGPEATVDL